MVWARADGRERGRTVATESRSETGLTEHLVRGGVCQAIGQRRARRTGRHHGSRDGVPIGGIARSPAGADDDVTIVQGTLGPFQDCGHRFGRVALAPVGWQEGVADFELTTFGPQVAGLVRIAAG